jgi:Cu2+-exporting ATPase/Cu+-exporting ATPase
MKFFVDGIRCSKCVAKIENIKTQNSEIQALDVDLAHQTATIELKEKNFSFATIAEKLDSLGYKVIPLRPQEDTVEAWNRISKSQLTRLALAGYCAGNIMLLSFAIYFGLQGQLRHVFEWLQFLLYLPVVSFVAWPFYKGLWLGLKQRSISIDGPMAIASFLGFAVSTWNLVRGEGSIYYDSTSGFLFLILATRYFQTRARYEYLKYLKPQALTEVFKARVLGENQDWKWIRSDELKKGDLVQVEKGEWFPADGRLACEMAILDSSVINGESRPQKVQKGFPVKAGTKLLSHSSILSVEKAGTQTLLGQMLANLQNSDVSETDTSELSNRASQILLILVLTTAAIMLATGFQGDFRSHFERAFALIVLACPCAMAFGTPLAFSFSMKRAQENGILVKTAKVFEKMSKVKTVFLDKTGTLTGRQWEIKNSSTENTSVYQKIILSLESTSQHPIAFALRDLWRDIEIQTDLLKPEDIQTLPNGVQGKIANELWQFHSVKLNEQKWFELVCENKPVWRFQLGSQIHDTAVELVRFLKKQNLNVAILSGDSESETLRVANELGIDRKNTYFELSAQDKAEIVRKTPGTIMIGDGVNDSLALQTATVGIAVRGGVDLALRSADVMLFGENLALVEKLFQISRQARKQIRKNLCAALIYNSFGGLAALLGFVNPFVAALLMPISSIFILLTTWWGTRK